MATTTKIFGFLLLVITTFMVLLGSCSSATVYKVGESDGWTAKDNTYYHWAELKEFHVGDSLVFEYDSNFNDITQVSGVLEYQFCDSSFPKPSVYNTGYDVVTFTEPGFHYFISSNHTRCKSGQRLDVLVIQDSSSPIPPPLPSGKIYKVGDSKGWSVYDSDFYYSWSKEKQLHVGDYLIFDYNNEVNDVLGISSDLEFLYCDAGSLVAVQKTSYVLVKLTKPGVHYFISSEPGHCEAGIKLQVVVGPTPNVPKFSPQDPPSSLSIRINYSSIGYFRFRFGLKLANYGFSN